MNNVSSPWPDPILIVSKQILVGLDSSDEEELDVKLIVGGKVGIGKETPSKELDVIGNIAATGDIAATNLNLKGSLSVDQNLTVSGNFQLGTLSINEFSSDGNLADNSNLAIPTEQAVKTYVDNQIKTRAALNGAADEDFATNNLLVDDSLTVSNAISTNQLNVTGSISAPLRIDDNLTVNGEIATNQLNVTGSISAPLTIDDNLTVNGAIATARLSVTGSLTVENDLTVGNAIATNKVNASGTIKGNKFEGDGSALTGISTGKWSDGSSGSIYYNNGNVGIGTNTPTANLYVAGLVRAYKLSTNDLTTQDLTTHNLRVSGQIQDSLSVEHSLSAQYRISTTHLEVNKYGLGPYSLNTASYFSNTYEGEGKNCISVVSNASSKKKVENQVGVLAGASGDGETKYKIGVSGNAFGKGETKYKIGVYGKASGDGGTNYGVQGLANSYNGTNYGIYGIASSGKTNCAGYFTAIYTGHSTAYGVLSTVEGIRSENGTKYGLSGRATGGTSGLRIGVHGHARDGSICYAGYFDGNVHVTGTLTKGRDSFLIDHPLDPLNKTLRHNCIESPEDLCLYRGKVELDSKGSATVQMPDYFAALTTEEAATVNLTPIGKKPFLVSYEWSQDCTEFEVFGEPNAEVAYLVLADRDDPVIHQLREPVEQEKGNGNFDLGKLLYPEAYGYSQKMGVDYDEDESLPSEITETIELEDLNSQIQD